MAVVIGRPDIVWSGSDCDVVASQEEESGFADSRWYDKFARRQPTIVLFLEERQ
jgi:hypothetical protein